MRKDTANFIQFLFNMGKKENEGKIVAIDIFSVNYIIGKEAFLSFKVLKKRN